MINQPDSSQSQSQMQSQMQSQSYNKKLSVRGNTQAIIQEMSKEENTHLKKLSFIEINKGVIRDLLSLNLLSNLRPSLKTLSIQRSCFMCLDDACIIADCVGDNNSSLTKLELKGNMDSDVWTTIISGVGSGSPLQKLALRAQYINAGEALIICDTIKNAHLVELSFDDCVLEEDEDTAVLIMAAVSDSAIETLILKYACCRIEAVGAIIGRIENSKLTKLSLYCTSFGDDVSSNDEMFLIADAIQKSSLKILDVRSSFFCNSAEDIISIIKFSSVTKFKFDHRAHSPEASIEVISAIKGRSDFKNISMRRANITDELLVKLCDLIENSSATQLDLSESDISEAQWLTIINSVCASSITSLIFKTNSMCEEDATMRVMRNLLEGCAIKKIKMNKLTNATMEALLPWIKQSSLIKFKLRNWSYINKNVWETIKETLKERRSSINSFHKIKSARTANVLN